MSVETIVTEMLNVRCVDFGGKIKKLQSSGVDRLSKLDLTGSRNL